MHCAQKLDGARTTKQQRQLGKPMHAPTQGVLNFYTYVPTLCSQWTHSSFFFSIELR